MIEREFLSSGLLGAILLATAPQGFAACDEPFDDDLKLELKLDEIENKWRAQQKKKYTKKSPSQRKRKAKTPAKTQPKKQQQESLSFEEEKALDRKELTKRRKQGGPIAAEIDGLLALHWLTKQASDKKAFVTLAVGSPWTPPSEEYRAAVRSLTSTLVASGRRIVFDADSTLAPDIASIAGNLGVGISGRTSAPEAVRQHTQVLMVSNPFARMSMLGNRVSNHVISDPYSLVGAALFIEKQVSVVFDPFEQWDSKLANWDVGYRWTYDYKKASEPGEVLRSLGAKSAKRWFSSTKDEKLETLPANPFPEFDPKQTLADLDLRMDIDRIRHNSEAIIEGRKTMTWDADQETDIPGGAVVFGSAIDKPIYKPLLEDAVMRLSSHGIPIATGGMGGFMEVANRVAIEQGGYSFGIPMFGMSLTNEKTVSSSNHTHTISSHDYLSRIPLLLDGRPLVIVAPGSNGTLKELATTLVMMASQDESTPTHVSFLSKDYYGELADWLHGLPWSERTHDRFSVISSADDVVPLITAVVEDLGDQHARLLSDKRPAPSLLEAKTAGRKESERVILVPGDEFID